MAPPSTRMPCVQEAKEGAGDVTASKGMLDVVTDLGARVAKNVTLHYYSFKEGINASEDAQERVPRAFHEEKTNDVDAYLQQNTTWTNYSYAGVTGDSEQFPTPMSRWHEFQIIKAAVLAAVTVVILISICKMVFQLFVRYTVKHDK